MPRTYRPITFADGRVVTPKSASESVTLKRQLAAEQRASEGRVSIADQQAEAEEQGLSRVGGVQKESRGQDLAEQEGHPTGMM